jgi:hypothetical protein
MRKGWRKHVAGVVLFLWGTLALGAPPGPPAAGSGGRVRLTAELSWRLPAAVAMAAAAADDAGLELEISEGQVVEATAWPEATRTAPARRGRGRGRGWRLGSGPSGRVRVRLEAPLGASLLLRAGGQAVRLPVLSLLDGPQRLAAQGGLEIGVERLAWDPIVVRAQGCDGTAAPGENVALEVGFNVLTPEPTEVALRYSAELRPYAGGEPVWRLLEEQEVVGTDVLDPARKVWNVTLPQAEGTYLLEIRTSWKPLAGLESTRLGRWIRRLRNPAVATSAVRRVALTVVAGRPGDREAEAEAEAEATGEAGTGNEATAREEDVEVLDLARLRGQRPLASGRAPVLSGSSAWPVPEAALVEAHRRDWRLGWIIRPGADTSVLPPADATGLPWSALGLKVPHPGRPHRLTVTVTSGHPSALGVALVDSGNGRGRPRLLLDACASGEPILEGGPLASFSWLVWPDDADPVLVLVNRDPAAPVQVGAVVLTELAGLPEPPAVVEPGAAVRGLGLYLPAAELLDRFGGGSGARVADPRALARNLEHYLAYCGASAVVLPEGVADRARRGALDGQASEDPIGPDRLDMLLRILGRQGYPTWLELDLQGPLPGLPAPDSPQALARGLVRVDRHGKADGPVPAYHPLHPEVRAALKRRVAEAAAIRKTRPGLTGLLIRLGPGPTLLGGPDTGFDDATFARFVRETLGPETTRDLPGLDTTDPNRFAARAQFLAGAGRMPWLTWRSRAIAGLYAELAAAARRAAPGATLAVATPGLDGGPCGAEARRVDLAGLAPIHAWRAVGLDLEAWPSGDDAPLVLRGVGLSSDELAHDLATNPELDAPVAARSGRGLLLGPDQAPGGSAGGGPEPAGSRLGRIHAGSGRDSGLRLTALPLAEGALGDEMMGHALAALDARWVMLASAAVTGHEERVRHFARVFRALPATKSTAPPLSGQPFGVAVRPLPSGSATYLAMANDTPYPIRVETMLGSASAKVDDLGRGLHLAPEGVGGRSRLVLDLLPFGVAAIRIGAPQIKVGPVTPYPTEAVLTDIRARYDTLFAQLSRLNRMSAGGVAGPANSGFEPAAAPLVQLTGARGPAAPAGWWLVESGASGATPGQAPTPGAADHEPGSIAIDATRPHSGRGSLRLDAPSGPAAIVSESFDARGQSSLTVQAWFRAAEPGARVRVWIEGEGAGQSYRRWSEVSVGPEWSTRAIRGSELPPGGLESARVRFELLSAGRLWIDDLSVSGDAPSESQRQITRRVLLAALKAYRDKRYADFARLAGSHWTRTPGLAGDAPGSPADSSAAERAEMIRTGKATALPPGRVLR